MTEKKPDAGYRTALNSEQPTIVQRSQQPLGQVSAPGASVQPRAPAETGFSAPPPKPKP